MTEALGKRDAGRAALKTTQAKSAPRSRRRSRCPRACGRFKNWKTRRKATSPESSLSLKPESTGRCAASLPWSPTRFKPLPGLKSRWKRRLRQASRTLSPIPKTRQRRRLLTCYEHRAGRATFLPLNRMRPGRDTLDMRNATGLNGVLGAALEIIWFDAKFAPALEVLLGPRLYL